MSGSDIEKYVSEMVAIAHDSKGEIYQDKEFLKAEISFRGALREQEKKTEDLSESLEKNTEVAMNRFDTIREQQEQLKTQETVIKSMARQIESLEAERDMALLKAEKR